jgi:hypothetical protein
MDIPFPGLELGQLAKKLGWKEKWMDSRSLAIKITYRISLVICDMLWIMRMRFAILTIAYWIWKVFGSVISFGSGQLFSIGYYMQTHCCPVEIT